MKNITYFLLIVLLTQPLFSQQAISNFNTKNESIKNGIVLFTLNDCSRCETAIKYFKTHKINFKQVNTSRNNDGNLFMWNLIKQENPTKMSVKFPVIAINGKLYYDLKNLTHFLKEIQI